MVAPALGLAPNRNLLPQLPKFSDSKMDKENWESLFRYLLAQNAALARELSLRLRQDTVFNEVQLVAPNGDVYKVTVDNTGALATTLVYQA